MDIIINLVNLIAKLFYKHKICIFEINEIILFHLFLTLMMFRWTDTLYVVSHKLHKRFLLEEFHLRYFTIPEFC